MLKKTHHAEERINKRKIPEDEIKEALEKGKVKRMTLNGRKVLQYNRLWVVVGNDGVVITAYYWRKNPSIRKSRQFMDCRASGKLRKMKGEEKCFGKMNGRLWSED